MLQIPVGSFSNHTSKQYSIIVYRIATLLPSNNFLRKPVRFFNILFYPQ